MPTRDMYAFVYVRHFQAWLPALSPWVASLALSWPTHRSDMWTCIEALPPCRLSMAGRRRVRPLVQPPGHMPARRGAGARKRQPGRSAGVSEPKPAVIAVEAVALMAVVTVMGRQQRFNARSTHSGSIRKQHALRCSTRQKQIPVPHGKEIVRALRSEGKPADMTGRFSAARCERRLIASGALLLSISTRSASQPSWAEREE